MGVRGTTGNMGGSWLPDRSRDFTNVGCAELDRQNGKVDEVPGLAWEQRNTAPTVGGECRVRREKALLAAFKRCGGGGESNAGGWHRNS